MAPSRRPTRADVVIVGAGSAGCVLADKLSRDGSRSVLLLERGPDRWPDRGELDLRRLPIGAGSAYATTYPEAAGHVVVRGRGIGGSSAVNGGYFLRWHRSDFDDWPDGWHIDDIEVAYRELDGPGGTMRVHPYADADLAELPRLFEEYWRTREPERAVNDRWPIVGLNRVMTNAAAGERVSAAEAYLRPALDRPNLTVWPDSPVASLAMAGSAVSGVRVGDDTVGAGEVILCAGTLGTAGILLRSVPGVVGDRLAIEEHREVLVRYTRREAGELRPLLQSVLHTGDGVEIRCYSDGFDRYVDGLPAAGAAIGVSAMRPAAPGSVGLADGAVRVRLDRWGTDTAAVIDRHVSDVREMLRSSDFRGIVADGSVSVDPVVRTSQHAWGSMPMGRRTDAAGVVDGVPGLRIVDGSILPAAGRSGPHATIMMMACRIGELLASGRDLPAR